MSTVKETIKNSIELNALSKNVTDLLISSNSCNELKSLNLNDYRCLKSIEIGDDCFRSANEFVINGLWYLKSLKIGKNSFTHLKSNDEWDKNKVNNGNRSFHISNCDELESIEIGRYSFCDYGGGFELFNLPKLTTLKVDSHNFCYSSFEIRGMIELIMLLNRSSSFAID